MTEVAEPPRWVRVILLASVLALAAIGAVGLLLADLGLYSILATLVLAFVVFVALCRAVRPLLQTEGKAGRTSHVAAACAVVVSFATMIWNGANSAEHVQINRDGAVYLNAGKWIATHGTLDVRPYVGPFTPTAPVRVDSTGMKLQGAHLEFALSHMYSAIIAVAQGIGGDRLMFLTGPILGGVGLLAFYLLASRLLRHPIAALGATLALAVVMPQVSFSRDSVTEIPIQVFLFTGLWMLCDRRTLRLRGPAFCVGLVLGLVQALHVDGLAFLVLLPAVYVLSLLHARGRDRERIRQGILWSALGVGVGLVLCGFDLLRWDHQYASKFRPDLTRIGVAEVLVIAIAIVVVVWRAKVFAVVKRHREWASGLAFVLAILVGFGAWLVRSREIVHGKSNPQVGYVQILNHLAFDPTRKYGNMSVSWISWYIGPVTLTLAIVAAAVLVRALVRGTARMPVRIAALMLAPPALLYIWKPSITDDHIWAMRRFVPAVFPALVLLAFGLLCVCWRKVPSTWAPLGRAAVVVVAVAAVAFPIYTIRNVSRMTEQRGDYSVVEAGCKMLGKKSAVVMLQERRSVEWESDPQTLRTFCNIPVAVMTGAIDRSGLRKLAAEWKADGRQLFVVAQFPLTLAVAFPGAPIRTTKIAVNRHLLEFTLLRRPAKYQTEMFRLAAAPVP